MTDNSSKEIIMQLFLICSQIVILCINVVYDT